MGGSIISIPPSLGTLSIIPELHSLEIQPPSEQGKPLHSGLGDLPTELRDQILQYLDLDAIKSIRLTSRKWALLSRQYLLDPEFEAMPYRDDFERLLEISQHPYFSSRVEQITIRMENVDEYRLRSNMYYYNEEFSPEALESALAEFSKCKGLQEIFKDDFRNPRILKKVFPALKNLEAVHIKTQECLYNHPLLRNAWAKSFSRRAPDELEIKHFIAILHATANSKLRTLSHDGLPLEIWVLDGFCQELAPAFCGLATLKLSIDCQIRGMDFEVWPKKLIDCLKTAPNLQELCLGFEGSLLPLGFSFSLLDGFVWQHLHTLALENLGWQVADFGPFLCAHAATLRRLRICTFSNSTHFYGSHVNSPVNLKDLLQEMKSNLKLEKLDVRGHPVFNHQPRETWLTYEKGIYDDNWEPIDDETGKSPSMSRRCEEYVIHNGLSPFTENLGDDV